MKPSEIVKRKYAIGLLALSLLMVAPLLLAPTVVANRATAALYQPGFPDLETAFNSALGAYVRQEAPGRTFKIIDIQIDGDWAYAVAEEFDPELDKHIPYQFIVLLAYRDPVAGWRAIAPKVSSPQEYNEWLEALPTSLMDESTKVYLHWLEPDEQVLNFSGHKLPWPGGQNAYVTKKGGSGHENQVDFDILGGGTSGNVYASKPGTVVFVKESSNSGCCAFSCWEQANMVVVQHNTNEYSWYVHLAHNSVPVSRGDVIGWGTKVGVEGETGYACGVHLHYMGSTGHTEWTEPDDPNAAPWGTGITAVDFAEVSWNDMQVGQWYTSQNVSSCCGCGTQSAACPPQPTTTPESKSTFSPFTPTPIGQESPPSGHHSGLFPSPTPTIVFPLTPTLSPEPTTPPTPIPTPIPDTTPPTAPTDLRSDTHDATTWTSDPVIHLRWTPAQDAEGPLSGYILTWDQTPDTEPPTRADLPGDAIGIYSPPLNTGRWYAHLRAIDEAGNAGPTAHAGPFLVDVIAPSPIPIAAEQDGWQNNPTPPTFTWQPATDTGAGVTGYRVYWGDDPHGTAETFVIEPTFTPPVLSGMTDVAVRYLRVAPVDGANNQGTWTTVAVWRYDGSPPTTVLRVNHDGETCRSLHVILYLPAQDTGSGLAAMRFSRDGTNWTEWEPYARRRGWTLTNRSERQTIYAQVRDGAGNESPVYQATVTVHLNVPRPASENYKLARSVAGMGGSYKKSASYQARGTSGQTTGVGRMSGGGYTVHSGFWSSSVPTAGLFQGTVTLQGRTVHTGSQLCVAGVCANTTADGSYTLKLAPGPHVVTASHASYLWSVYSTTISAGETADLPPVQLRGGDVNGDGEIDILDLTPMSSRFGSECSDADWDPTTDINGDCTINIQDLAMTGGNFGQEAPQPWTNASATDVPSAQIEVTSASLVLTDTGIITLTITGATGLYGVQAHLTFDPAVVQLVDADPTTDGIQATLGDLLHPDFVVLNRVDNSAGTIEIALTQLAPTLPSDGDGVLALLTFQAVGRGASPIGVANAVLADAEGEQIQADVQEGVITVLGTRAKYTYLPLVMK